MMLTKVNPSQPYMATQIILPPKDRPADATVRLVLSLAQTLGATIFVSGSQSICQNKLASGILAVPGLNATEVLSSGVSTFRQVVPAELLPQGVDVAVKVGSSFLDLLSSKEQY